MRKPSLGRRWGQECQLIFALTSLLLIVIPLWLKHLRVVPHRRVSQKDSHVGAHFSFGAKRLCAPRLVDHVHNSKRIDQLNIFEEGTDVFDVSAVFVIPLELKPRFINIRSNLYSFTEGVAAKVGFAKEHIFWVCPKR